MDNAVVKTNDLSFYNDCGTLILSAKQYDTGRKFKFRIINDFVPFDLSQYSCYLRAKKADDTEFQSEECYIIDGCTIIIDTSLGNGNQLLTAEGLNLCELHLTDYEGISLTTWTFAIEVVKRVHNGDNLNSEDSWDRLDAVLKIREDLDKHLENTSNVENKSSEMIRDEITKENVTNALGYTPYTPNEIDNKFSSFETNIDWKEAVETFDNIETTYPTPEDGWTVNTKDTDYTYRYNGTDWVCISANAIPKATESIDGLMTKESFIKLETIENGAEINQNTFSIITDNNNHTIIAGVKEDVLILNGENVNLTFDTENNKITIAVNKDDIINALGYTPGVSTDENTTYSLSKTDNKIILTGSDGYFTEVNDNDTIYEHPNTSGYKHIPSGGTTGDVLTWSEDGVADWNNLTYESIGALGKDENAVSATKATKDSNDNIIVDTYATKSELSFAIGEIETVLDSINRTNI